MYVYICLQYLHSAWLLDGRISILVAHILSIACTVKTMSDFVLLIINYQSNYIGSYKDKRYAAPYALYIAMYVST